MPVQREKQKWVPSIEGWVKVNSDGAVDSNKGVAGAGMVIRDHIGQFLAGGCWQYGVIQDPLIIEMLACRDAVQVAKVHGFSHVILETDSQVVVSMWNRTDSNKSVGYHIIGEIKEVVGSFQGFNLLFARREANSVAHLCAREALSLNFVALNFDVTMVF
jgi:ribonuclease HI